MTIKSGRNGFVFCDVKNNKYENIGGEGGVVEKSSSINSNIIEIFSLNGVNGTVGNYYNHSTTSESTDACYKTNSKSKTINTPDTKIIKSFPSSTLYGKQYERYDYFGYNNNDNNNDNNFDPNVRRALVGGAGGISLFSYHPEEQTYGLKGYGYGGEGGNIHGK
jgi:hypothetical protein